MATLVSAHKLSKTFATRALFTGLTFTIESGDRIGLIGPNGAGKSTLLKILAGQTAPDEGSLSVQRGLRVGFLEQNPSYRFDATISETILEAVADPHDWEAIALADELTSKLELDHFEPDTRIEKLSGGWRKRVALARELVKTPDLLLLDEPTNHLDVESILWLEEFLARARFATLTITHDRLFLQRIANRILELDPRHPGGLLSVQGDYTTYLDVRSQLIAAQERREIILKNTLRRETEWLRRGAKARTTKQQARIARHGELSSEVEDLNLRNQSRTARIDFQAAERNPKILIETKGLTKSYDQRVIFSPLDLILTPGTRIGLLGQNGSGKSTMIRSILGLEKPTAGTVKHSDNLSVAYFDQTREALDPNVTVAKTLCPSGEHVDYRNSKVHIRSYLDRFLFTQQQMDMAVGKLSGGEQSRLLIARLMLTQANLLVLDEPTNDLDMATLAILEECLTEFTGAVILVTHDRYFLDQVANRILAFGDHGRLEFFADLSQWEDWYAEKTRAARRPTKSESRATGGPSSERPTKKNKLSFNEQRELDSMESNIQAAESQLDKLTKESALPENLTNAGALAKLSKQMAETQARIDFLYQRWAELAGDE